MERDHPFVHRRFDVEPVAERRDRGGVVRRLDLHPIASHAGLQCGRRVENDDPAGVDDGDAVRVLSLVHVVRGQEDRDVVAPLQLFDVGPDVRACLRVEPDRRLVEEQHARRVQEAPGDLEPPHHPAGERHDLAVPPFGEADHRQDLVDPSRDEVPGDAVQLGVELQVDLGREVGVERRVLEDQPDVAADRVTVPHDVVPGDKRGAGRGRRERAEHLDRGGLAGTVRAQGPEGLAAEHVEVNPGDGLDLVVAFGQPANRDDRVTIRRGSGGGGRSPDVEHGMPR
jgi:hypothetical protein